MEQIVNIIVNNGVAVGLLIYFVYRDNKFMDNLTVSLKTLEDSVASLKKLLEKRYENEYHGKHEADDPDEGD